MMHMAELIKQLQEAQGVGVYENPTVLVELDARDIYVINDVDYDPEVEAIVMRAVVAP